MADQVRPEAFALPPIQGSSFSDNVMSRGVEGHEHLDSTEQHDTISLHRTIIVISSVTIVTAILGYLNGLVTVGIPVIAPDLHLASNLILWCVLSLPSLLAQWPLKNSSTGSMSSNYGLLIFDPHIQATGYPIPYMRLHSSPFRVPSGHFW